ncbi:MAG: sugar-binding transcriptional regulator [Candidatus Caldatribacterium sp.]|nr:sugar-binding transcriptional regulator [Candidatus Caldatribacterium sp.]
MERSLRNDEHEMMAKIARLYYEGELSIVEIAEIFGISRQRCSRLLHKAKERGIVQIRIVDPASRVEEELETELCSLFGLRAVRCVEVFSDNSALIRKSVGVAAGDFLLGFLRPGTAIGVAYGRTIYEMVRLIRPRETIPNLTVVQIMGSMSRISGDLMATEIPRQLGEVLGARVVYLLAPAFTKDRKTRDTILRDAAIQATLSERLDIAVVGIGGLASDSTLIRTGAITEEEVEELKNKGAVGDIVGTYFDLHGNVVPFSGDERRIALSLEALRRIPLVIGIVGGQEKVDAVIGALRGKLINALVIDSLTTREVLKRVLRG